MRLIWQSEPRCSALAALASRECDIVSPTLRETVAAARSELAAQLPVVAGIEAPGIEDWRALAVLAAAHRDDRDSIGRWLGANLGPQQLRAVAEWCRRAEQEIVDAFPESPQKLQHRLRPLREQWESRGPGLLQHVIENSNLSDRPDRRETKLLLVYPTCGGGGWADPERNTVVFEALLANPDDRLPEVLRLAWFLLQLVDPPRPAAAWIEPLIAAGRHVELCQDNDQTARLAAQLWRATESARPGSTEEPVEQVETIADQLAIDDAGEPN
ncbi:MAG: hypothetical protein QGG36_22940 [Pirellulaceae bacterium]|nr:hypothetical protein [Pirellulaceae bacterium]